MTPCPGFDRKVDGEHDRGQPRSRIHDHKRQQRARAAEHAEPGEHRRCGRWVHERKKTMALGPRIDIKPLPNGQAHLIPQAVVLGGVTEDEVGDRKCREDQHRTAKSEPPERARSEPSPSGARPGPRPRLWLPRALCNAAVVAVGWPADVRKPHRSCTRLPICKSICIIHFHHLNPLRGRARAVSE